MNKHVLAVYLLLLFSFFLPLATFATFNPNLSPVSRGIFYTPLSFLDTELPEENSGILPSFPVKSVSGPKQKYIKCKPYPPALSPNFVSSIPTVAQLLNQGLTLVSAEGGGLDIDADCAVVSLDTVEIYYKNSGIKQCRVFTESKTATPKCPTAVIDTDKDRVVCWNEQGLNPDYSCGFKVANLGGDFSAPVSPAQPVAEIDDFNTADFLGSDNPISNAPSSITSVQSYTYPVVETEPVYGNIGNGSPELPPSTSFAPDIDAAQVMRPSIPGSFKSVSDFDDLRFGFAQPDASLSLNNTNIPVRNVGQNIYGNNTSEFGRANFQSAELKPDSISLLDPIKTVTVLFRDSILSLFADNNDNTSKDYLEADSIEENTDTFIIGVSSDNALEFLQKDEVKIDYNQAVLEKMASQKVVADAIEAAEQQAVFVKENTACAEEETSSRCLVNKLEQARKSAREVFEQQLRRSSLSDETVQYYLDVYDGKIDPAQKDIPAIERIKNYERFARASKTEDAVSSTTQLSDSANNNNDSIYGKTKTIVKNAIADLLSFLKIRY